MPLSSLHIAVFTSGRSDYGLLKPLIRLLAQDSGIALSLLAAGGHLSARFGNTRSDIEADGFAIAAEFPFLAEPPEADYLTRSLAHLQAPLGAWLYRHKPDWLIVLGDRFELLAAAGAALLHRVPLAHISGGDVTEGAIDNQVRHAVTKMAQAHFPATPSARDTLLALGEEPWRICVSGEPGLDQIAALHPIDKAALYKDLGLDAALPVALATFHPDTLTRAITPDFAVQAVQALIGQGFQVMATGANFDEGGDAINAALQDVATRQPRLHFLMSLGQTRYYSLLRYADVMVGNSSSGIVEAQSFGLPVVNVGTRQQGRLANPNVVHAPADSSAIVEAAARAIGADFRRSFADSANLYGDGKASERIVDFLKRLSQETPRDRLLAKH